MHEKQTGIIAVESLLIIVVIVTIAFGGYYIKRSNDQSRRSFNNAIKVSQAAPYLKSPSQRKHYLSLYQWGVKGLYIGSLKLSYVIFDNGHQRAYFTSSELSAADPSCSVAKAPGGYIDRYLPGERLHTQKGTETIEQYLASGVDKAYSHAGKYYYVASSSQYPCRASEASLKIQTITYTAVVSITKSLIPYCSVKMCG